MEYASLFLTNKYNLAQEKIEFFFYIAEYLNFVQLILKLRYARQQAMDRGMSQLELNRSR